MKKKLDTGKEPQKMTCEEFRRYRYSYKMSQEEWANAVGISVPMVKLIETNKRDCSAKTAEKVWEFIGSGMAVHHSDSRLQVLEERILYDIFLEHMENMDMREASGYAAKCIRPLLRALSKASYCSSLDAQKKYFDFLEAFLYTMHMAASEYAVMANEGKAIPDIRNGLIGFADKQIRKARQAANMQVSNETDEDGQYRLPLDNTQK